MMRSIFDKNLRWVKSGDITSVMLAYRYGGETQAVTYQHQSHDALIKAMKIYSEHPGELNIRLTIDVSRFKQFEKYLLANGYPLADKMFRDDGYFYIQIPNPEYLTRFLNVLAYKENDISLLTANIIGNVQTHMCGEPTIPGWQKNDSLEHHPSVSYVSTSQASKIRKLVLEQSIKPGAITLYIRPTAAAYEEISRALIAQGFYEKYPNPNDKQPSMLYTIQSKSDLEKALHALIPIENSVANVMQCMMDSYDLKDMCRPTSAERYRESEENRRAAYEDFFHFNLRCK